MDVKFIDASDWIKLEWYNSGGTRAKRVLQSPEGDEWYFKCSERKPPKGNNPEKYYRYEFWSEIIAYQLGKKVGLNILRYDIAIHEGQIGCISPLMIKRDEEQLIEVGRYMTSLNPDFLPEDNTTRHQYTFQLLENTIDEFDLVKYWSFFFEVLLFDAVIGNTDRHQENWAFLGKTTFIHNTLSIVEERVKKKGFEKLGWINRKLFNGYFDPKTNKVSPVGEQIKLEMTNIVGTAPIYDNGSSLGRELTDERAKEFSNNEALINKYINNGKAEVHWNGEKLSHFDLIGNLLNSSYLQEVISAGSFLSNWDDTFVVEMINNIDKDIPPIWHSYCIPKYRKDLIIKLLILRSEKLRGLFNDRV